jgi:hypothetical protein
MASLSPPPSSGEEPESPLTEESGRVLSVVYGKKCGSAGRGISQTWLTVVVPMVQEDTA